MRILVLCASENSIYKNKAQNILEQQDIYVAPNAKFYFVGPELTPGPRKCLEEIKYFNECNFDGRHRFDVILFEYCPRMIIQDIESIIGRLKQNGVVLIPMIPAAATEEIPFFVGDPPISLFELFEFNGLSLIRADRERLWFHFKPAPRMLKNNVKCAKRLQK